jgi:hypothetical protein
MLVFYAALLLHFVQNLTAQRVELKVTEDSKGSRMIFHSPVCDMQGI